MSRQLRYRLAAIALLFTAGVWILFFLPGGAEDGPDQKPVPERDGAAGVEGSASLPGDGSDRGADDRSADRALAGRVVDSGGQPVLGGDVVALDLATEQTIQTRTLEGGRFSISVPVQSSQKVFAFRVGIGFAEATVPAPSDELELRLAPLARVSGRTLLVSGRELMVGDGSPIADVGVSLRVDAMDKHRAVVRSVLSGLSTAAGTLRTDAQGRYSFEDLLPGSYRFEFGLPHLLHVSLAASGGVPEMTISGAEQIEDLDFVFDVGGAISGTVYSEDALPLEGAKVRTKFADYGGT